MDTHAHTGPVPAAAGHPAPRRHLASLAALWFGFFGAPLAWSVQELVNTPVVGHACFPRSEPLHAPVFGGTVALALAVSAVTALVALAALLTALRTWRSVRLGHDREESALLEVGEGRTRFMALAGILLGAVFLLGIVMHAIPILLVPPCG
jgi:hypothetical protein